MSYVIKNQGQVAVLVDFIHEGRKRELMLWPGQYYISNNPIEVTWETKRELVDVGLVDVYEVRDSEHEPEPRDSFQWQEEGF